MHATRERPSRSLACRLRRGGVVAILALASCGKDRGNGVPVAESIALTASRTGALAIGQTLTLYVHASDANGTRIPKFTGVTWGSSNATVASVAKADTTGVVTGLAVGETVISATVRSGVVAQITVRVGAVPVISLSPTAAVFTGYRGTAVTAQVITITNGGAGQLTGLTATSSQSWLQASFVDGNTTANPTAGLRLQPSTAGMSDGSHSATVTVSSGLAGVASRTVPVTLQVSAGPVAFKVEAATAPTQTGSAGRPVSQPPAVVVRAVDDTPVAGFSVTFAVAGGGTIAPSGVVQTNANGIAALTSWTLGSQTGAAQTVTATAPGLAGSPVTFTATTLTASKIIKVSGDNQSTVVGRTLAQPIVVRVVDPNDAPVPNASVTFAPVTGGSVAPTTATTDANGQASATWAIGSAVGSHTLNVSLVGPPGSPTATFTATGTGPTAIEKVSGDAQQAYGGTPVTAPLVVRVTGANNLPAVGVAVTFLPGGGAVPSPTVATDANGLASTSWTLPLSNGPVSLTASVSTGSGTVSVTFSATAVQAPPGGIQIVDGDNQTGDGSKPLPKQIVARVVTIVGTPVPGATVTFTPATGAGQSFSPASGVANSNGEFRTTWNMGPTLGTYTATVSSPGVPSRTITAIVDHVAPNVSSSKP